MINIVVKKRIWKIINEYTSTVIIKKINNHHIDLLVYLDSINAGCIEKDFRIYQEKWSKISPSKTIQYNNITYYCYDDTVCNTMGYQILLVMFKIYNNVYTYPSYSCQLYISEIIDYYLLYYRDNILFMQNNKKLTIWRKKQQVDDDLSRFIVSYEIEECTNDYTRINTIIDINSIKSWLRDLYEKKINFNLIK